MRAFVISIVAATGAATIACAQSTPEPQRIEQPRPSPQAIAENSSALERQPSWIDESATPAGAGLPAAPPDQMTSPSAPEIRQYLAQLTDVALSAGSLASAAEMLCTTDRERLGPQMGHLDLAAHDRLVELFRQQWKTRYGQEFTLAQQRAVVADYFVMRGQRSPEEAIVASDQREGSGGNGHLAVPAKGGADEDRAATLVVPPSDKANPAMILILANENAGTADWRLNTPDSLSAQKLQQNLDARLKRFVDGQATWPADEREAYRAVTYQVLATFNDQPVDRPHPQPERTVPANPSLES